MLLPGQTILPCVSGFSLIKWPSRELQQAMSSDTVQEQNVQVAAGLVGAPPQASAQAFEYTAFVQED